MSKSKSATAATGRKTECPITREQFRSGAKPLPVIVDGRTFVAGAKEFSTGSLGYFINEKTVITIDGVPCKVQINCSVVLVGSKEV